MPYSLRWASGASCAVLLCTVACADAGTAPPDVSSVAITAPASAVAFQTFGRTLQFSAEARRADNSVIAGATFNWQSSAPGVATINGSGLLTVVGNGSSNISASLGGVPSAALVVTVTQVPAALAITPTTVAFGALGSTRQLAVSATDSGGAAVTPVPTVTWTRAGSGATAGVSASGLVTALAVGASDTAVATLGALQARAPITVTQVVASVLVTVTGGDTLRTTGRTRQYAATPRDSQLNSIATGVTWSSATPAVATVDGDGLATAVADGSTQIRASAGGIQGGRTLVVARYAATFSVTPPSASITAAGGGQGFAATALDSVGTALPVTWSSSNANVLTVAPTSGANTTATATGNGVAFVRLVGGQRRDSAEVTVSGQATFNTTASVEIGDFFFRSVRNGSDNAAVDTIAVDGTVTWTWTGSVQHNVLSVGTPSFVGSAVQLTGTFSRTFTAVGDYRYECQLHPTMTGRIIVR